MTAESNDGLGAEFASVHPKLGRRLSDKILVAFHCACDLHDVIVAERLLSTVDKLTDENRTAFPFAKRRLQVALIGAHHRLSNLKRELDVEESPPAH